MGRSRIERRARELEAFLVKYRVAERPGLVRRTTRELVELYNAAGEWLKPPLSGIDSHDFAMVGRRELIGDELNRRFGKGGWYANGAAYIPATSIDPEDLPHGP